MNIPWSGFTKKRNYKPEKDRLQYKDLAGWQSIKSRHKAKLTGQIVKLGNVQSNYRHHSHRSLTA